MTIPSISGVPLTYMNNTRPVDHAYFLDWIEALSPAEWYMTKAGTGDPLNSLSCDYGSGDPTVDDPERMTLGGIGTKLTIISPISNAGSMYGTPWGASFRRSGAQISDNNRVVQHACASQAAFNAIVANNSKVILDVFVWPTPNPPRAGITRNGYTSTTPTDPIGSIAMFGVYDMLYWDFATSQAVLIKPYKMVAPVPFNLRKDPWPILLP